MNPYLLPSLLWEIRSIYWGRGKGWGEEYGGTKEVWKDRESEDTASPAPLLAMLLDRIHFLLSIAQAKC